MNNNRQKCRLFLYTHPEMENRMTDRDLKRLSRADLMERLLAQVDENEKLGAKIEEMEKQLNDRQITTEKAGSIAEAALQLSGVIEAAQEAAEEYLENVRRLSGESETILRGAKEEAGRKAEDICAQADEYSREMRRRADAYREQAVGRIQAMLQEQDELRSLLRLSGKGRAK